MKDLKDIENILKSSKLPESDMSSRFSHVWRRVIYSQKVKRKYLVPYNVPPWIWSLAGLILIILCIVFMVMIKN